MRTRWQADASTARSNIVLVLGCGIWSIGAFHTAMDYSRHGDGLARDWARASERVVDAP